MQRNLSTNPSIPLLLPNLPHAPSHAAMAALLIRCTDYMRRRSSCIHQ